MGYGGRMVRLILVMLALVSHGVDAFVCAGRSKASYSFLIDRLQPIVKRIMFGEACSSVPIFKKS